MSTANNSKTRAAKQASMAGEVQFAKQASPTATQVTGQEKSETKVLSAMQTSLGKAMEKIDLVSKLLMVLQANIEQIKDDNAGLRTDVDGILQWLEEAESRISQLEDENVGLRRVADQNARKCEELNAAVQDAA